MCEKVSSAHRGVCVTTGGFVQAHSPVCSTLELHREQKQKSSQFFFGVVRLGGVFGEGGGMRWSMFQEVGVCMGFQRGGGVI